MATMNISLPDAMKAFVEEQAAERGFETVSEYVRSILRDVQERHAERERINALLLEGLNSGRPEPMTDEDWEFIQSEALRRVAERKGRADGRQGAQGR
ncbi:MAG TPA: type II toxin-antitoxin system ParD family antitoxin [Isosphaeraceae bacterium]